MEHTVEQLELPSWLGEPEPADHSDRTEQIINRETTRALLMTQYENIFERVVEGLHRGRSLKSMIENDHRAISYEGFMQWIKRDVQRNERYKDAQEARTEFIAGEILDISDGIDTIDPTSGDAVSRDKLRIDTRKWIMGAHNRKRYGEVKQLEVAGSISIIDALQQAQQRVVEAELVEIEDATLVLQSSDTVLPDAQQED